MTILHPVKSVIFLLATVTLVQMPLHREIANKMRTKKIMRKPSIQQPNKAIAKPPTALTTTAWQVTRQASKGHRRAALLLDRGQRDPIHRLQPEGAQIVHPSLTSPSVLRGLTQHEA